MFITFFFSSLHYCTKSQEKQGKEAFFSVFNLSVTRQPPALKPWNLKPLPQNWGTVISDESAESVTWISSLSLHLSSISPSSSLLCPYLPFFSLCSPFSREPHCTAAWSPESSGTRRRKSSWGLSLRRRSAGERSRWSRGQSRRRSKGLSSGSQPRRSRSWFPAACAWRSAELSYPSPPGNGWRKEVNTGALWGIEE